MDNSLFSSKSMRLVIVTMLLIVAVFFVAVIAEAVFSIHVPFVTETMTALTGNSGIGVARNAYTDGPIRLAQAQGIPPLSQGIPPVSGGVPHI